jgi:TPR repeat protein
MAAGTKMTKAAAKKATGSDALTSEELDAVWAEATGMTGGDDEAVDEPAFERYWNAVQALVYDSEKGETDSDEEDEDEDEEAETLRGDGVDSCPVCGDLFLAQGGGDEWAIEGQLSLALRPVALCGHRTHVDCADALRSLGWAHGCARCHAPTALATCPGGGSSAEEAAFSAAVLAMAPELAWCKRCIGAAFDVHEPMDQAWCDGAAQGVRDLEALLAAAGGDDLPHGLSGRAAAALGLAAFNGAGQPSGQPGVAAAARWWAQAAAAGNPAAQGHWGQLLCDGKPSPGSGHGRGWPARDATRGQALLQRGAAGGDPEAMLGWGMRLSTGGPGVGRDLPAAIAWLAQAAGAPHFVPAAQYNVGVLLRDHPGLPLVLPAHGAPSSQDAAVVAWFEAAAEQGHPAAMANLGVRVVHGLGVAADPARAARLWRAAAARGNATAARNLASLQDIPSPAA